MYATDVDPEESAKTRKRLAEQGFGEDILTIKLQNFCTIDEIAEEVGGFDFILADLGVSSMQIDNPKRGFSFKVDGPLDLRLNQETGISAAQRLDTISREELAGMLDENSDEPYCEEIAKAITDEIRRGNHIDTTTKLREVIEKTLSFLPEKERKDTVKKTCQRVFQALRIDVNRRLKLEEEGIAMASAEVTMIPQTYVDLTKEEDIKNIQKTLDLLDEDDDVQDVYHNWNE